MLTDKPLTRDELIVVFFNSAKNKLVVTSVMSEWVLQTNAYIRLLNGRPDLKPNLWTFQTSLSTKQKILFIKQGPNSTIKSLIQTCMEHVFGNTVCSVAIPLCADDIRPLGHEATTRIMVKEIESHLKNSSYQPEVSLIIGSTQIRMCQRLGLTPIPN